MGVMKAIFVLVLLGMLSAGCASRSTDAIVLDGLPPLKDPAAWVYDKGDARWVLLAMRVGSGLRAWTMQDQTVGAKIDLELPEIEEGYVRWGPCLFEEDGTLWMCSGVGRAFDWPTYRLRVAECRLDSDVERDGAGNPVRMRFRDEREIDYMPGGEFMGARDWSLIDPEYARDRDGLWLFATVVLHGAPGVRPHEEFIRVRRAESPRAMLAGSELLHVHDGFTNSKDGDPNRNIDDGVAEAPTWLGKGRLLYSSWPSDNDQRIGLLESERGAGGPWSPGPMLLAANPEVSPAVLAVNAFEELGVGGQTAVTLRGRDWVIYQGLGTVPGDDKRRFRLAMRDLDAIISKSR